MFRPRFNINSYDDVDLFKKFRFRRETIEFIVTLLTPFLLMATERSKAVSPTLQVLAALRYFATGAHMNLVGDSLGLSQATVSRCIRRVARALVNFTGRFIKFPTTQAHINATKLGFFKDCW